MPDNLNFKEEKAKLITLVKRMATEDTSAITKDPHPFFGKMTTSE